MIQRSSRTPGSTTGTAPSTIRWASLRRSPSSRRRRPTSVGLFCRGGAEYRSRATLVFATAQGSSRLAARVHGQIAGEARQGAGRGFGSETVTHPCVLCSGVVRRASASCARRQTSGVRCTVIEGKILRAFVRVWRVRGFGLVSRMSKNVYAVRDLIVWQKAMTVAERVYATTREFPPDERYGLAMRCRRAAVSIVANIAEGHGRRSVRYFVQFLRMSRGSAAELDTQLELAFRLNYLSADTWADLRERLDHVSRLLANLSRSLIPPSPSLPSDP